VSDNSVWTADGALQFSQYVSDHPETPGSPNMGWVLVKLYVFCLSWLEAHSNFRFVQSKNKMNWTEQQEELYFV